MTFAKQNDTIVGRTPAPTADDVCLVAPRFVQEFVQEDGEIGNVGAIGILPAGCTPALPMLVDSTGIGSLISIGILNADGTDLSNDAIDGGGPWATGVDVNMSGAYQVGPSLCLMSVKKTSYDRLIAIKFESGCSDGTVGITVAYRSPV